MPKLNFFKFQDGKVFWLPEYPEKEPPAYEFINPEDDLRRRYDKAIAHSLASAIEVAPEDMEEIRLMVVKNIYRDGLGQGVKITSMTQPLSGKVYSVECEMEIELERCHGQSRCNKAAKSPYIAPCPHRCEQPGRLAHLKPKDDIFPAANSHDMKEIEQQDRQEESDTVDMFIQQLGPQLKKSAREYAALREESKNPQKAIIPPKPKAQWRVEEDTNGQYITNGHLWLRDLSKIAEYLNQNKPA